MAASHGAGEDAAYLLPAAVVQSLGAQAEDAIYDSESMRRFARVELGDDVVPDETTICVFAVFSSGTA